MIEATGTFPLPAHFYQPTQSHSPRVGTSDLTLTVQVSDNPFATVCFVVVVVFVVVVFVVAVVAAATAAAVVLLLLL